MKRMALLGSTLVLMGSFAWADGSSSAATKAPGPCKQIVDACSSAGFVKGEAKEGKGLYKNCVQPILAGQSVNGVTVDPSVVAACQQRREKHQQRKQASGGSSTSAAK